MTAPTEAPAYVETPLDLAGLVPEAVHSPGAASGTPQTASVRVGEARSLAGGDAPAGTGTGRGGPSFAMVAYGTPAPQGSKRHVGRGVMIESSKNLKPWREAVKYAALAAKPDVDAYFPKRGPCLICGVPGMDQRHRVVDAITERVFAGDPVEMLAADYDISERAVTAALFPLDGPLRVEMAFTLARPSSHYRTGRNRALLRAGAPLRPSGTPDLSKLARAAEDSLTDAGIVKDDARIVEYSRLAKVFIGEDPDALPMPGVLIRVWAVTR